MRVGFVVPVYNGSRFLRDTLESIVMAMAEEDVLAVVDDGSTDSSLEVARCFAAAHPGRAIHVLSQQNQGVSAARNLGARAVLGLGAQALWFVDQDDLVVAEGVSSLRRQLARNPSAPFVAGQWLELHPDGSLRQPGYWMSRGPQYAMHYGLRLERIAPRELFYCCPVPSPGCVLVRGKAFELVGGFDADRRYVEDHDLWMRLVATGDGARCEALALHYRFHEGNTTKRFNLGSQLRSRFTARLSGLRAIRAFRSESLRDATLGFRDACFQMAGTRFRLGAESLRRGSLRIAAVQLGAAVCLGAGAGLLSMAATWPALLTPIIRRTDRERLGVPGHGEVERLGGQAKEHADS